jgi:hypothetical protein
LADCWISFRSGSIDRGRDGERRSGLTDGPGSESRVTLADENLPSLTWIGGVGCRTGVDGVGCFIALAGKGMRGLGSGGRNVGVGIDSMGGSDSLDGIGCPELGRSSSESSLRRFNGVGGSLGDGDLERRSHCGMCAVREVCGSEMVCIEKARIEGGVGDRFIVRIGDLFVVLVRECVGARAGTDVSNVGSNESMSIDVLLSGRDQF